MEKRIHLSPPQDWAASAQTGKLPGVTHFVVSTVVIDDDGTVLGKPSNHRVAVAIQPDGTWRPEPEPAAPCPPLTDEQRAMMNAVCQQHAENYGVIDHTLPDGRRVTYEMSNGKYVRVVT